MQIITIIQIVVDVEEEFFKINFYCEKAKNMI